MNDKRHPLEWAFDQLEMPWGNHTAGMAIIAEFTNALLDAQKARFNDARTRGYWGA